MNREDEVAAVLFAKRIDARNAHRNEEKTAKHRQQRGRPSRA